MCPSFAVEWIQNDWQAIVPNEWQYPKLSSTSKQIKLKMEVQRCMQQSKVLKQNKKKKEDKRKNNKNKKREGLVTMNLSASTTGTP